LHKFIELIISIATLYYVNQTRVLFIYIYCRCKKMESNDKKSKSDLWSAITDN